MKGNHYKSMRIAGDKSLIDDNTDELIRLSAANSQDR